MIRRLCATLALVRRRGARAGRPRARQPHAGAQGAGAGGQAAKLNCLQKYPVYAFADYVYFEFASDTAD
jgi:hypothetical protein